MADDRTRRFAKLPKRPTGDLGTRQAPKSLDLFEHYGVATEPAPAPEPTPLQPIAVLPCPDCQWLRATPLVEPCPVCAAPPVDGATA